MLGFAYIPNKLSAIENFINTATLLPLDEEVTNRAIDFRRHYKKLKLGDAIIAATAVEHGLTLISHNTKDFVSIKGLKTVDPYKI
jgi:predicted nucleic acid-binding protein